MANTIPGFLAPGKIPVCQRLELQKLGNPETRKGMGTKGRSDVGKMSFEPKSVTLQKELEGQQGRRTKQGVLRGTEPYPDCANANANANPNPPPRQWHF